jgi:hypothetical protein
MQYASWAKQWLWKQTPESHWAREVQVWRSQAPEMALQRKFWEQITACGSVQAIGAQWLPSRHAWPGPQLVGVQGETQLVPEQTSPVGHCLSC